MSEERQAVQVSPTRLLLAFLNGNEIKIKDAAATLKMDPNQLRTLATTSDKSTAPLQAQLVARLKRYHG